MLYASTVSQALKKLTKISLVYGNEIKFISIKLFYIKIDGFY